MSIKWKWERKGCKILDDDNNKVAVVNVARTDETSLNQHGNLISAAPEMYEALVDIVNQINLADYLGDVDWDKARAATSKAEGF